MNSGFSRLRLASIGMLILLAALYIVHAYGAYPYAAHASDTLLPSHWLAGHIQLVPDSIDYTYIPQLFTVVPEIQVSIAQFLGISILEVERWRVLSGIAIGFVGLFMAGYVLSRSVAVGVMTAAVLPVSWISTRTIGYQFLIWECMPPLGAWAMAATIPIWALWLRSNITGASRFWIVPYILAGLLFNIHPTYALVLMGIFGPFDLYAAARSGLATGRLISSVGRVVLGGVVFLLCSLPQAIAVFISLGEARETGSPELWWRLMLARKQHHLFQWRELGRSFDVAILVVVYLQLVLLLKSYIPDVIRGKLLATLGSVLAMIIFTVVGVELFWSSFIASLVLTRSSFFIPLGIVSMIGVLFWSQIIPHNGADQSDQHRQHSQAKYHIALLLPLLLVPPAESYTLIAVALLFFVSALLFAEQSDADAVPGMPDVARAFMGLGILLFAASVVLTRDPLGILAVGYSGLVWFFLWQPDKTEHLASLQHAWSQSRLSRSLHWAAGICLVFLVILILRPNLFRMAQINTAAFTAPADSPAALVPPARRDWLELAAWMRENSPPDALFLMPPQPGNSPAISLRSSVIDMMTLGYSVYVRTLTEFETQALQVIYRFDLPGMSWAEIHEFSDGFEARLWNGYENAMTDERIASIKAAYPGLSYVVGVQSGAVPVGWRASRPFVNQVQNVPIAFKNDTYVVYDVRNLHTSPNVGNTRFHLTPRVIMVEQ